MWCLLKLSIYKIFNSQNNNSFHRVFRRTKKNENVDWLQVIKVEARKAHKKSFLSKQNYWKCQSVNILLSRNRSEEYATKKNPFSRRNSWKQLEKSAPNLNYATRNCCWKCIAFSVTLFSKWFSRSCCTLCLKEWHFSQSLAVHLLRFFFFFV